MWTLTSLCPVPLPFSVLLSRATPASCSVHPCPCVDDSWLHISAPAFLSPHPQHCKRNRIDYSTLPHIANSFHFLWNKFDTWHCVSWSISHITLMHLCIIIWLPVSNFFLDHQLLNLETSPGLITQSCNGGKTVESIPSVSISAFFTFSVLTWIFLLLSTWFSLIPGFSPFALHRAF